MRSTRFGTVPDFFVQFFYAFEIVAIVEIAPSIGFVKAAQFVEKVFASQERRPRDPGDFLGLIHPRVISKPS